MDFKGEEFRKKLIDWIMEDDDFFFLVTWSLGAGIRQIQEKIEKGVDDDLIQMWRRIDNKYGITTKIRSRLH